jgi:dTDP-4-dehydrorhamnose 3,5-epimerase
LNIIKTAIPDVLIIEPKVHGDHRGFFMETWRQSMFDEIQPGINFVQDNHSRSSHGILRGLHYQLKHPQGKLVRVVAGEIFDVAVDMRKNSPTFGQWEGQVLSAENRRQLWVPPGFAHGFYVMSESAEMVYKCTGYYVPIDEYSLRWDDPDIAVNWPLAAGEAPVLSDKDRHGLNLREAPLYS